jgi:hypothetical protein
VAGETDNANVNVKKRRPGRRRRIAGWTLVALGVVVAGGWGMSRWWAIERWNGWYDFRLGSGGIVFVEHDERRQGQPVFWRVGPNVFHAFDWTAPGLLDAWPLPDRWDLAIISRGYDSSNPAAISGWSLVLWPIPIVLGIAGVSVLRLGVVARRRAIMESCGRCGYSLAGLGDGAACPECGKAKTD